MITRFGPIQLLFVSSADNLSFSLPLPPQPLLPAGKYFGALEVSLTGKMFNDEMEMSMFRRSISHSRSLTVYFCPRSEYSQIACLHGEDAGQRFE